MKTKFLFTITFIFVIFTFISCEKTGEDTQVSNTPSIEKSTSNFLQISFDLNKNKRMLVAEKDLSEIIFFSNIGTENATESIWDFEYSSIPDSKIVKFTDKSIELEVEGKRLYYDYVYDEKNNSISFIASNNMNDNVASIDVSSNECKLSEMTNYFKENETISFKDTKNPVIIAIVTTAVAVVVAVGLWTVDQYCDTNIQNDIAQATQAGMCYTVHMCCATPKPCNW